MSGVPAEASPLPLFYRAPEPVSSERHRDWRLLDGGYGFAAEAAYVPVVTGEFAQAARHYPIVFAAGEVPMPVALVGLEQANLFVSDGTWAEHVHIPAYVRRYPFGYVVAGDDGPPVLAIDSASERVAQAGGEGEPLFEDGQPSALTRQAPAFCEAYRVDAAATAEFCGALVAAGLLVDRRADLTLPDGAKFGIKGFSVLDSAKFANLDAATIVDWQHRGWLALAHHHLASLGHFHTLLARKLARAAAQAA